MRLYSNGLRATVNMSMSWIDILLHVIEFTVDGIIIFFSMRYTRRVFYGEEDKKSASNSHRNVDEDK